MVTRVARVTTGLMLLLLVVGCEPVHQGTRDPRATPSRDGLLPAQAWPSAERRGISVLTAFGGDPSKIKVFRSLAVTEVSIVGFSGAQGGFSLQEVLEALACPPDRGCTSAQRQGEARALFQQWWTLQSGTSPPPGMPCPPLFDFPYCPRAESLQASEDPFGPTPLYIPIGLFNRIDLAEDDGADCGEYRIVFGRNPARPVPPGRVFLNFEAVLPNPKPADKLAGCKAIAEFWRDLGFDAEADRASKLRRFYFEGAMGMGPVLHVNNFSNANGTSGGQIRTNQFMQSPWMLREFRLVRSCPKCRPVFVANQAAQTPFGPLFADTSTHPQAAAFKKEFISQVSALAKGDLNNFTYRLPTQFVTGQSVQCDLDSQCLDQRAEGNYLALLGGHFLDRIAEATPTPFTGKQIVARALALSCAGCHQISNRTIIGPGSSAPTWPRSLGFVHISETDFEDRGEGRAFKLSEALAEGSKPGPFLLHRASKLQAVLDLP